MNTEQASEHSVKVFVAEDAPQVRQRIVALLGTVTGVEVVGESDSVRGAIDGALNAEADALLLDLQLIGGTGLEVLAALKPLRPALRVIVLSNFATPQYQRASRAAGADFCLDKSQEFGRVPEILRGWLTAH